MSVENYEENITKLQQKLNEINQSFQFIEQDLHNEDDLMNKSLSRYAKSIKTKDYQPKVNISQSNIKQSRPMENYNFNKQIENYEYDEEENEVVNEQKDKILEEIINQNDNLKEEMRQKEVQIESLQFRYEKIQSELTLKMKEINQLNLDLEEKESNIKKISTQKTYLQDQVNKNQNEFRPHYQKLKSQYDICLLEMKSLENDNDVLEKRIKGLTEVNLDLKNQNRDLKNEKHKIEMERLQALKTIELLKSHLNSAEHDFFEINEKNQTLAFENERLKNELLKQEQILKQYQKNGGMQDTLLKTDFSKKFDTQNIQIQSSKNFKLNFEEKKQPKISQSNYKNRIIQDNVDRLDFNSLKNLGEKLSKVIQIILFNQFFLFQQINNHVKQLIFINI